MTILSKGIYYECAACGKRIQVSNDDFISDEHHLDAHHWKLRNGGTYCEDCYPRYDEWVRAMRANANSWTSPFHK